MKSSRAFTSLYIMFAICFSFISCGDGDEEDNLYVDKSYTLEISGAHSAYIDWDAKSLQKVLHLYFGNGIKEGSDWQLTCDENWITLRDTRGQVQKYNLSEYKSTVFEIVENNRSYEDREAKIKLYVPSGSISGDSNATVWIIQYGYQHYLSNNVRIKTNRTKADNNRLTISGLYFTEVVEVDWGDGVKEYFDKIDFSQNSKHYSGFVDYSISHQYPSSGIYEVKMKFGRRSSNEAFSFNIKKGQGIEYISIGNKGGYSWSSDNSRYVTYTNSDNYEIR